MLTLMDLSGIIRTEIFQLLYYTLCVQTTELDEIFMYLLDIFYNPLTTTLPSVLSPNQ
jgi:hypothetical protein